MPFILDGVLRYFQFAKSTNSGLSQCPAPISVLVRIVIVLCAPTFLLIFGRKLNLFLGQILFQRYFRQFVSIIVAQTNVDFDFCKLFDDVITFAHQCVSYSFGAPRNSAPFPGFVLFPFFFPHGHDITYQPFAGTSVVGSMKTLIWRNIAQLVTKTTKPP